MITILCFIIAFLLMEGVAWMTHKFLMHGPLWMLHADHHYKGEQGFFEKNDSFFLIFSIPGILLILSGVTLQVMPLTGAGLGITAYGACYFLVHDIFIHQRFSLFRNTNNRYLRAVRRAHKVHHKNLGKEGGSSFGMLFFPLKYWKDA